MLFSSTTFIFGFLLLLIILYFPIKNIKYRNVVLLIFSLIFYSWGEPKYVLLMLLTVLIAYIFGILIDKYRSKKGLSKTLLILSIVLILSNLFVFKYLDFSIEIINTLFKSNFNYLKLSLPIGISFYTFQILSYVIDLYRKDVKVQKNYFRLLLYVSFFPQLIAGPIVRYQTVEDEIFDRTVTFDSFIEGFKRFIWGLSKKVIIANNVAIICDYIYGNYSIYGSNIIWIASISYTLQIYFDFSGYSDMAIGLGKMFGFNFLENFNYPYTSKSITDFWRRWHISLSSFFRDYVYIPLGGNRVSKMKFVRNIFVVWFLTGIWHGASFNYIIWGIYYAVILLLEKLLLKKHFEKIPTILRYVYSIFLINIGWVIFRMENLNDLMIILKKMFTFNNTNLFELFKNNSLLIASFPSIILGIVFSLPIDKWFHNKVLKSNKIWLTLLEDVILGLLFGICIMQLVSNSYNPFIYFRF